MRTAIALIAMLLMLQAPPDDAWEPDPAEVTALAQTLYGECRGCSEIQQRAVCWCVFNRVDSSEFPNSLIEVVSQPCQFFGYSPTNPVWQTLYELAYQAMVDWHNGENRPFSADYCFFYGDGSRNHFTTRYGGGEEWCEG